MNTQRIVWNMVRNGWSWTVGIGALLGAGYGIVLFATAMLSLWEGGTNAQTVPLVFVMIFSILIAALFGAVVAAAIGFVAGPIGGLLCALMTRYWFSPPSSERLYRVVAAITGALYGVVAIAVAVRLISTSGFAPPIQTFREAIFLYVIPGLLGGAAGIFISRPVVDSFLRAPGRAEPMPATDAVSVAKAA